MPKTKKKTRDGLIAKAFAHPARGEVLTAFTERTASPAELAEDLGHDVRYLSYHIKLLRDWKLIQLVKEEPKRGAIEHFYRATTRTRVDMKAFESLSKAQQGDGCGQVVRLLLEDYREAADGGTLTTRPDWYAGRTLLDIDEQGWREISERIQEVASDFIDVVQAESANRIAKSGEKPIRASASILFLELPAKSDSRK